MKKKKITKKMWGIIGFREDGTHYLLFDNSWDDNTRKRKRQILKDHPSWKKHKIVPVSLTYEI